ncbi:MAG: hypothetical protein ACLT4C_09120 [Butyricicoccus sp.]
MDIIVTNRTHADLRADHTSDQDLAESCSRGDAVWRCWRRAAHQRHTKRAYKELERDHQPDRTRQLCCTGQQ